jgi:undecaprenyl diphosphate synthase
MNNLIKHLAFIVDGNGRWATEKNLERSFGHIEAVKILPEIINITFKKNIKYITLYLFSTENWNRSVKEINVLMELYEKFIKENHYNFNIKIIGDITKLPFSIQQTILECKETESNKEKILILALSYSGKYDILETCKKLINNNIKIHDINETQFSKYTSLGLLNIPDPDLIVRTSGEIRISNFYLWNIAYSELFFIKKYWPDINEEDIDKIIYEFLNKRNRRFGKIK